MSICTTCLQAEPMPKCIDELILAQTELDLDTAITIYYKINSTGVIGYVPGIIDADGKAVTTEPLQLPTNQYITLWFTLETDQQNQHQVFTFDSLEYTCIDVRLFTGDVELYDLTIVE